MDSAGTGSWHEGGPADERSQREGVRRGCRMDMIARQVHSGDFKEFDLIVAMDSKNYRTLLEWPGADASKVRLASEFAPDAGFKDVPDPYYEGPSGFAVVADMLEAVSQGILRELATSG